jgi:hypothetical protein
MTTAILLAIILALLIRLWYRNAHIATLNEAIDVLSRSASDADMCAAYLLLGVDLTEGVANEDR